MYSHEGPAHTLAQILEQQASRLTTKPYLIWENEEISYKEFNERVNRVANSLHSIGIAHSDKVGLLSANCAEFLYTFFACAKLGAVIVPVNHLLKGEEIQYACENSDMKVLVAAEEFRSVIESIRSSLPNIHTVWYISTSGKPNCFSDVWKKASSVPPKAVVATEDLMSIIYTSGTTGRPKGVLLSHANYYYDTAQVSLHFQVNSDDRVLCFLPLFHVNAQVASTLACLLRGATLVLLPGFSPQRFLTSISEYKVTIFSSVPTVYGILNNLPDYDKYDLSSLRHCLCGASPMPVEVFNDFEKKYKAFILEGYGQSEGTCWSTMNPLDGRPRKVGSIGIALAGQQVKIFDSKDKEVPTGQIGEIVIRGPNVMRGYYKNEAATKDTLKNGWLHSGDLGYVDAEGYFYITGRKKEMIIRGGENIYPKEVEELLYRHPSVLECAVIGVPDKIWGEQVAVAIILKPGKKLPENELFKYCKDHVADYKCPTIVRYYTEFPKTATGKIQKNKIVDQFKIPLAKL